MTIAQALKEKNQLTTKLNKSWEKVLSYNSIRVGATRPYPLDEVMKEVNDLTNQLVNLKTSIHSASSPVREKIFLLSEKKSMIKYWSKVNTSNGPTRERYASEETVMDAYFSVVDKDQAIELLESQIDEIQAELDKFNHTTHI
jgi:hypothetical protein